MDNKKKYNKDYFIAFIGGAGSILNIFPKIPLSYPSASDSENLRKDWEAIGSDFRKVLGERRPRRAAQQ